MKQKWSSSPTHPLSLPLCVCVSRSSNELTILPSTSTKRSARNHHSLSLNQGSKYQLIFLLYSQHTTNFYEAVSPNKKNPLPCNQLVLETKEAKWSFLTCRIVTWAERVVASLWSVCTFLSSSLVYRIFLSFDRAADCLLARILHNQNHQGPCSIAIVRLSISSPSLFLNIGIACNTRLNNY